MFKFSYETVPSKLNADTRDLVSNKIYSFDYDTKFSIVLRYSISLEATILNCKLTICMIRDFHQVLRCL